MIFSKEPSRGMTQKQLHAIIERAGTQVIAQDNAVEFFHKGAALICISDPNADRMRIMSPIADLADLNEEHLKAALRANFHSVLDARYALSGDTIFSAFLHPLTSLTEGQVISAIDQVAEARNTFGEEYSSGELYFPG